MLRTKHVAHEGAMWRPVNHMSDVSVDANSIMSGRISLPATPLLQPAPLAASRGQP